MTAKEYLNQAWSIKIRLEAMSEQLAFLKSAALCITPQYSDMPRPATRNVHKNEDAIIRVMDFEERLRKQYDKLDEINETISGVSDPTAQRILAKRYFKRNTWNGIARQLYLSRSRVFALHNAALDEIQKKGLNRTVLDE